MSAEAWQPASAGAVLSWLAMVRDSGWEGAVLAAGYAASAVLCAVLAAAERREHARASGAVLAAVLLALLGAIAPLHLDVLAVELMRGVAHAQGWYAHRRAWQLVLLLTLGAAGAVLVGRLRQRSRERWPEHAPVALGVAFLLALAALKAVSLHQTDGLVNARILGASAGRLAEFGGLAVVTAGALRRLRAA